MHRGHELGPFSLPSTSFSSSPSTNSLLPVISDSLSTLSACSGVAPATAIISAATLSRPILASLSSARNIGVVCLARPKRSSMPESTWRLLTLIVKSGIRRA